MSMTPEYYLALREAGPVLLDLGNYFEAASHLHKAQELVPGDERTLNLLNLLSEAQKSN